MWQETSIKSNTGTGEGTYDHDLNFLNRYTEVVELVDPYGNSRVLVCPEFQGRVMTSTTDIADGISFGWINYDLISSRKLRPQINPFGGEDRFWLGPEGGQYSIFFKQGDPFDLAHAFTPPPIDSQSFEVEEKNEQYVRLKKEMQLENYSGSVFNLLVNRTIRILRIDEVFKILQIHPVEDLKVVAFQTENKITNIGNKAWEKASGLLSIWILGQFKATDDTTVVIPMNETEEHVKGYTDDYFGKVPADRLIVKNNTLFFRGDADFRSKIGVSLKGSKPIMGSYDAVHEVLTLVQFSLPENGEEDYVNSLWEMQVNPYNGDVINSYNDGPAGDDNKQLGNFYELETSSPAAELRPDENLTHVHRTIHLHGNKEVLNEVALKTLGVGIESIKNALPI